MKSTVLTVSYPGYAGGYRSVPMEKLLTQARYLAEAGVKELIVIAQETTLYGKDLYGEKVAAPAAAGALPH